QPSAVPVEGHAKNAGTVAFEGERRLTAGQVPDPDFPIPVGRGQPPAIGAESDAGDLPARFLGSQCIEGTQGHPVVSVPDLHGPVPTGRGEELAIWAEGHAVDGAGVALERADLAAAVCFPNLDLTAPVQQTRRTAI